MSTISKRLFGPAQLTNAAATMYTVPTGRTAQILRMRVSNPTASPVSFTLSIGADAPSTRLYGAVSVPAGESLDLRGAWNLAASEFVQAYASVNSSLVLEINGTESGDFVSSLAIGPNSLTWREIFSNTSSLPSNARNVPSGAIVLAWVGMGAYANLSSPTDNQSNTYSPLLPAHNYQGWLQSGQRSYAATGVSGSAALVVTEAMPVIYDEVTLSVVAVTGGTAVTQANVIETTPGPVTASVTVDGPAMLVSSWWGDGGLCQDSVTPSAGWTLLHELGSAQASSGVLQTAAAYRFVPSAGTYTCTWTANDGQGAVAYIVAVQ